MRKDQGLFLAAGVALGLVIGLVFGYVFFGEDAGTSAPTGTSAASATQGGSAGATAAGMSFDELRTRLAANPNDVEALVRLGDFLLEQNQAPEAAAHYERALQGMPDNPQIVARAAVAHRGAGNREEALGYAMKALDMDRDNAQVASMAFDVALHGAGDLDAAARALDEFRRRAPGAPVAGQMQADLEATRQVVADGKAKPEDLDAQVKVGNFYYDTGQWAASEAAYRRALAINPLVSGVLTDLGYVVYRQDRIPEALELFERALAANPQQWQAALNGTVISIEARDGKGARQWLDRLRASRPEEPNIPAFEQQIRELGG